MINTKHTISDIYRHTYICIFMNIYSIQKHIGIDFH